MHCNPRVPLAANKLVSEDWTKTDHRLLQKIYVIWYSFWILGASLVLLDFLKFSNFLSLDPVFPKTKIIYFWFQTMKNDWVLRRFFERYITILSVSANIIEVLFFQLVSLFEKLEAKFESFFIIKNTLIQWWTYLFLINLCNVPVDS